MEILYHVKSYQFIKCINLINSDAGHNAFQLVDGKYGNVGYDPQLQKFGLQYGNGLVVSLVEKDNAKFQMEQTDTLDVNGKITSKTTKIKYEIKEQITQADVEHAKVTKK